MSIVIYVPDVPEFGVILKAVAQTGNCKIEQPVNGYYCVVAGQQITLQRKQLGIGPALWNSLLSGGYRGRITEYGRDNLRIESES